MRGSPRPAVHLTPDTGWVNDPYGVVWFEGEYHLFFQFVPESTSWRPECRWGHATGPDLVRWRVRRPALEPAPDETGCWSGSAVVVDGELQLFYTRVAGERLGLGQIVRARPDGAGWRADPERPLVHPPTELGVRQFRDPFVFRHNERWVMVVGAGLEDGSAAVVQYVSDDLVDWIGTGILCALADSEPVWTGSVWECPQLFPLGDTWVLVVSVWHEEALHRVVAATGEYDGERFTPARWQALTHGDSAYAMSAFLDRDGRRCVISWLRERPDFDAASAVRAGAESLPYVVTLDDRGALSLELHPDVDHLRGRAVGLDAGAGAFDVRMSGAGPDAVLHLTSDETEVFSVPAGEVRSVVVDADIVELCTGDSVTVVRLPAGARARVAVEGQVDEIDCHELEPVDLG